MVTPQAAHISGALCKVKEGLMIVNKLKLLKALFLTSFFVSGCAKNAPIDVGSISNIVQLSDEMAKAYTAGTMKALTYAGANNNSNEYQDHRFSYFKVKGGQEVFKHMVKALDSYCTSKGGDFVSQRSNIIESLNVMSCVDLKNIPIFTTFIGSTLYNQSKTLHCHSVLAVENKSMKAQAFADRVLALDKARVKSNFYNISSC